MSEHDQAPPEQDAMSVWIYKSDQRAETYLYVPGPEAFERVPPELLAAFGRLELVLTLELHPRRPLARENVVEVMRNLSTRGFHLQLPPVDTNGRHRVQ